MKMLNENTFPLMLQNREGKYIFRGVHPLRKFGQFAEIEDFAVDEPAVPNVVVHDVEDVFEVPSLEQEAGSQIAIEPEIEIVFDVETEIAKHQIQIDMQQDLFNSENLTALLQYDELVDAGADLAPRKRRRRDPRPGAAVSNIQMPLDLKQKLQDKFHGEFTDESSPNAISASTSAPELTQAEKDNITLSHAEGLRRYFAGETRFKVDVEHSMYNLEGDRTGIVCWDYDALKEIWWIHWKLSRRIEYYTHPSSFQSFTMVDLIELAGKNFFNPMKVQRGENFYNSLQQHVRSGFYHMKVAKSVRVKKKLNSLGNPLDVNFFEIKWPPTERVKRIPILSDLHEGLLENFKFWAFDPEAHGVIIKLWRARIFLL
ncbi:hypothetical protein R6Q57_000880 [Mikania cordata]